MAAQTSKKRKFVTDGVFKAELNEFLTRELAEDGYSGVEVRVTPTRTEIIILATRTQNVLGDKGRRIRELTSVVQKRFNFPEGSVELYAEKVATRGLCAIAQAESLRYKLIGGLAVRRACYGVLRFIMESGAKGCEVVVSGKLRGQRAKSMKFVDGLMIHSGEPTNDYVDTAVRVLGIKVKIMLPWDPNGKIGPKRPLPDHVSIVEPKEETIYAQPISEQKGAKPEVNMAVAPGLYAGTVPSLVANVAENSVLFAAYGICQKCVQMVVQKEKVEHLTVLENAFSGFLAAFFSALTLCPTELIKCRLQAAREMSVKSQIGPWALTRNVLKQEGVLGFYRGFTSTLVREMPGYFFFFGGYEISRELLTPPGKTKNEIGLLRTIISGAVGGLALWTVIFPADVLKSRIQISGSNEKTLVVLKRIVRQEGIRALYSGLGPTLVRTIPATGALFVAFEYSKKYMHAWTD
uniref:40S ribosomal protein S3 n=1 Tax=Strigamia maritima TaxID=126957 RepID=T1J1Q4_STRMM